MATYKDIYNKLFEKADTVATYDEAIHEFGKDLMQLQASGIIDLKSEMASSGSGYQDFFTAYLEKETASSVMLRSSLASNLNRKISADEKEQFKQGLSSISDATKRKFTEAVQTLIDNNSVDIRAALHKNKAEVTRLGFSLDIPERADYTKSVAKKPTAPKR